ncbi:MAG TPA: four helix bundle protein [Candidatus Peribacteraceae bacterium]|nr:four helix bundle protein [Candidatus Peribacteraceae bacterium]
MLYTSPAKGLKIESFTDLIAWQEGHKLVLMLYSATNNFPIDEKYGLINQLRRAAVSITSNIAEGFRKNTVKEKRQFYQMALGSLTEIQNQLIIARDVGYIDTSTYKNINEHTNLVGKLLTGLLRSAPAK